MDTSMIVFLVAVLIVGIFIFIAIGLNKGHTYNFDKQAYQAAILNIEHSIRRDSPDFSAAVIKGDKLLDKAMCELGIRGNTMGERLKTADKRFSKINQVWNAHKMRNAIAHEVDFEITYQQATHAIEVYKQALKDLGAI